MKALKFVWGLRIEHIPYLNFVTYVYLNFFRGLGSKFVPNFGPFTIFV